MEFCRCDLPTGGQRGESTAPSYSFAARNGKDDVPLTPVGSSNRQAFRTSDTARTTISACGCEEGEYEAVPCAEGQLASCEICDKCGEGGRCKGPNYDDCTTCGDDDFYLDASGGLSALC